MINEELSYEELRMLCDRLHRVNAGLAQDQERLEWLVDQMQFHDVDIGWDQTSGWQVLLGDDLVVDQADTWRNAIDKARARGEGREDA